MNDGDITVLLRSQNFDKTCEQCGRFFGSFCNTRCGYLDKIFCTENCRDMWIEEMPNPTHSWNSSQHITFSMFNCYTCKGELTQENRSYCGFCERYVCYKCYDEEHQHRGEY